MGEKSWDKRGEGHRGPWDTIVIGSGMGSMTTAALLAEVGERVLVLEQHYEPGGFTHTFRRPGGYRWDVGVHAIGEVTLNSLTGRILQRLTDGNLEWASLGPVYDSFQYPDGLQIEFPDSPHQFRDNLAQAFPNRVADIGRYFDEVRNVSTSMRAYYLSRAAPVGVSAVTDRLVGRGVRDYFLKTCDEVMASVTDDARLRKVLTAQWGYYGVPPSRASFAIQALVARHFMWGAYYPVGGSQRIAETLLGAVAKRGGWTRIASPVDEILVRDGAAVGVRLGEEVIFADRVVSGVGAQATISRLLAPEVRPAAWAEEVMPLEPAAAHVCAYLGFKGDIRAAGAGSANRWFYQTWDQTIDGWHVVPGQDKLPMNPLLYCSFPSLKDPTHEPGPEQRHTGEVVTFVPWSSFAPFTDSRWKKRGETYDAFKARLQTALLEQFFSCMPELEPMLDFVEFSTPASTAHFDRAVGGSIYGLAPLPSRFAARTLRPRTPIGNLFLAGCDVATPGVIGALFGGVLAALAARPLAVGRVLREVS